MSRLGLSSVIEATTTYTVARQTRHGTGCGRATKLCSDTSMDSSREDVERVLAELNDAIAEATEDSDTSDTAQSPALDQRRHERRSVVADRRAAQRRSG